MSSAAPFAHQMLLFLLPIAWMTVLWLLRRPCGNDGLVDFGWPVLLVAMAVYFYGRGAAGAFRPRTALIAAMYAICGARMAVGWLERLRLGPDARWRLWREKWAAGRGLFGIRSPAVNFFFFYQAQAAATAVLLAVPLRCVSASPEQRLGIWDAAMAALWCVFFALENVADYQLLRYRLRAEPKPPVMDRGLWRYSRHPNYFCEFMLWVSYALYALPAAGSVATVLLLTAIPAVAYWFLMHFTGIPMTEAASLRKRGAAYLDYQQRVSAFCPRRQRRGGDNIAG